MQMKNSVISKLLILSAEYSKQCDNNKQADADQI